MSSSSSSLSSQPQPQASASGGATTEELFKLLREHSAEREALKLLGGERSTGEEPPPFEDQPPVFAKPNAPVAKRRKRASPSSPSSRSPASGGAKRKQRSSTAVQPPAATITQPQPPDQPSQRDEQRASHAVAPLIQYLQRRPHDRALHQQFQHQLDPRIFIDHPLIPIPSKSARRMRRIMHDWIWHDENRINYGSHRLTPFAEQLERLESAQERDHCISLKRSAEQLRALDRMLLSRRRRITMDEPTHEYRVDGQRIQQNVTSTLDELCGEFDEERTIDRMLANTYRWKQNKHYASCNFDEFGNELTREEKAERLKRKWRESREDGTRLHKFIEQQYDRASATTSTDADTPSTAAYFKFEDIRMFNGWLLVATEYPVYDVACSIAGTVDAIYMPNPLQPRQVVLVDWKRAAITTTVGNMTYEHPLMARYAKGNYWKYAMQLNIYREILERNYDLHVIDVFLVSMPPGEPNCHVLGVPRMLEATQFMEVLRQRRAADTTTAQHT